MNLLLDDPVLQTGIVGSAVGALASAITLYLWHQDRSERYLLYWSVAWACSSLRWAFHVPAATDAAARAIEDTALPATVLFQVLGCYELLPHDRLRRRAMTLLTTAFFVLYGLLAASRGVSVEAAYAVYVAVLGFSAVCMWRAFRLQRLSGYLFALACFVWQAAVVAATLYWLGRALSDHVVVPLVYNTTLMVSIVVIAYQRRGRQLAESEHTMQKIFETAPTPLVIVRPPAGEIERANAVAFEMLGLSAQAGVGRSGVEHGLVADVGARQAMYAELQAGRRVDGREIDILRGGSEQRRVSVNADRIALASGDRYVFSFYDLTELRRAEAELRSSAEQTHRLYARLASVEDDERRALHAELHDQVGANLAALRLQLDVVAGLLARGDGAGARRQVDVARETASETIAMARDLMAELRPPALDDYGLLAGLRTFADAQSARLGLPVRVTGGELEPRPGLPLEGALFRIAQEAVVNAARHARATRVAVDVAERAGRVILTVEDDGIGFDPEAPAARADRWGLKHMRERALAVGGTLHVRSAPGAGTRITAEAPRAPG